MKRLVLRGGHRTKGQFRVACRDEYSLAEGVNIEFSETLYKAKVIATGVVCPAPMLTDFQNTMTRLESRYNAFCGHRSKSNIQAACFKIIWDFKEFFQGKLGLPETFDGPDIVENKVQRVNVSH